MGQIAVITGGTSGIGLATARALLARGDTVTITGRDLERAQKALAELDSPNAHYIQHDATDPDDTRRLVDTVTTAHGRLDVLVTNAGTITGGGKFLRELPDDGLAHAFRANVESHFWTARAALNHMVPAGYGRIVTVSSALGQRAMPLVGSYVVAKHALIGLTRQLAAEVAGHGIAVNTVAPGITETPMLGALSGIATRIGLSADEMTASISQRTDVGRLLDPAEIAATVAYLTGRDASGMSGACVTVDGGYSNH